MCTVDICKGGCGLTKAERSKVTSADLIVLVHCYTNGMSFVAQGVTQEASERVSGTETVEHSCMYASTH